MMTALLLVAKPRSYDCVVDIRVLTERWQVDSYRPAT